MERLTTRSHSSRALEWVLILIVILLLGWYVLSKFEALEARALRTMALYEHRTLETHIQLYRIRHGSWPPTLREALGKEPGSVVIRDTNARRERLVDEQGRIRDPYGRPYRYDPETGNLELPAPLRKKSGD